MRMPLRRAIVAAAVTALTLPATASASCLPICEDKLLALMNELLGASDDDSGTLCAYAKLQGDPPPGWSGGGNTPPYIWVETEEWGKQHRGAYDRQLCVFPCVRVNEIRLTVLPDPSDPVRVSPVDEAVACASRLLP